MQKQLTVAAAMDNLEKVTAFLDEMLEMLEASPRVQLQLELALEEAFVNVVHYAYPEGTGEVMLLLRAEEEERVLWLSLSDSGVPFNPLEEEAPDVSLSARERSIGGLGIFLVRKNTDEVSYEYCGGRNILTMKKNY